MDDDKRKKSVMEKRGYRNETEHGQSMTLAEYIADKEMEARLSVRNATQNEQISGDTGYKKLRDWVSDSLDAFKNELESLLFPVFVHLYLDLVSKGKEAEANALMEECKGDFAERNGSEIKEIEMVKDSTKLKENTLACAFLTNKYCLRMGKYAFDLFISFLESNSLGKILRIVNQFLDIRVYTGKVGEEVGEIGIAGASAFEFNKAPVVCGVQYISPKAEEILGREEQYKHEHLGQFLAALKKKRSECAAPAEDRVPVPPSSASTLASEIEKLKELAKRVNVGKQQLPSVCCYTIHNAYESVCSAAFSNDMKLMAVGYKDSYIEVHSLTEEELQKLKASIHLKAPEARSGKEDAREGAGKVVRLVGHSGPVHSVRFFANKRFLLSCSQDTTVRLWSLDTYSEVAVYRGHFFPVWDIEIAENDYYFATGSSDRTACVWAVESSKPVRIFAAALSDVMCVKFHPNGNYLFAGSCDYKVRMYDLQSGELVRLFVGHKDAVTCLDVSACGKQLLSGGKDKTVVLWDIATGRAVYKYTGHEAFVFSVGFSHFSPLLVSSGGDNSVRFWDRQKGDAVCAFYTKSTPVIKAVFGYRNIVSCVGAYMPKK